MPSPRRTTPTQSEPARGPTRLEVRASLEEIAARLFATNGYAATSVDEIVSEAGVSKPAFYRHFESKKFLHMALLERHRDELASAALAAFEPRRGALNAQLAAAIDAWFVHVEKHPYTWRLLFRDTTHDPDVEALHRELQRRQRASDVALLRKFAPNIPAEELEPLGEVIRSSLTGLALWWLDHPKTKRAVLVSTMLRVMRGCLRTQR
jgi:AcrR family transcriptional regulator